MSLARIEEHRLYLKPAPSLEKRQAASCGLKTDYAKHEVMTPGVDLPDGDSVTAGLKESWQPSFGFVPP